jgi:hypothetical protein
MEFDHSTDTISPDDQSVITIGGTGGLVLPIGTTAQRPSSTTGLLRYNTDTTSLDLVVNGAFQSFRGVPTLAATSISAAGTTQGTATAISAGVNNVTIVASGAGVVLPTPVPGDEITVVNRGANALLVYPDTAGTIDGLGTNAGYTVAVNKAVTFISTLATQWEIKADMGLTGGGGGVTTATAGTGIAVSGSTGAVTFSLAPIATNTILANITGSSAAPSAATGTQVTTVLDTFTSALKGLAPASGGGNSNYLRADGTWANPAVAAVSTIYVRVASTGNVTISSAPATIDGVTLVSGDIVLLKDQTAAAQNGPYTFNGVGVAMTRDPSMDTNAEAFSGLSFNVDVGTVNYSTIWGMIGADPITLGTTALFFAGITQSLYEITLNFGTVPTKVKTFSVPIIGLLAGTRVDIEQSGYTVAGQYFDEAEFEHIQYVGKCVSDGTLRVIANSTSPVKGQRIAQLTIRVLA